MPVVSAIVAFVLLSVLFVRRKRPSVAWASAIYLINATAVVIVLLMTNLHFAVWESHWDPFQASKLGCLVAALLATGFWVGLVGILVHSLSAYAQFQFFFPPELKARVAGSEPWPIFAFALAGVLAMIYGFRRAQLEQESVRVQAQNFAIRRLAHAFLSIRDLMNTPLQVIELSIDLLRKSNEPAEPLLDRADRSVESLREINSVPVQYEKEIEWQSEQ